MGGGGWSLAIYSRDWCAIWPVNAFKAGGNHQAYARQLFGHGAVFTRRAFAIPRPCHCHRKAALAHCINANRQSVTHLEPGIGILAKFFAVMRQDGDGRNLVGRDVSTQGGNLFRREVGPQHLRTDLLQVCAQKQHAALKLEAFRPRHDEPLPPRVPVCATGRRG